MRLSECYGITESDIKKEKDVCYIDLHQQLTDLGYYTPLKTKEKRIIPIADCLVPLVHQQSVNHSFIKNHMKPIIRSVGDWELRGLCIHSFRHFFITDTKANEINPLFVESIAGHSLNGIEATYTNFHVADLESIRNWQKKLYSEITGDKK